MATGPESPENRMTYRAARRAFIAACEKAHIDAVARLHPSKGPDGKPLFMDCAALGPRLATKAVLVVGFDAKDAGLLTELVTLVAPPAETRLVLVHAFDPARFAGVQGDPAWPPAMLAAVATEDLSRVRTLGILALGGHQEDLKSLLQARLPGARIAKLPPAANAVQASDTIAAFLTA
jgi:hypothetical protein